jgi:hypothetical protein
MTDSVILIIDNDRTALDAALWMVRNARVNAPIAKQVEDGIWTQEEAVVFLAADDFKVWLERYVEDMPTGRFEDALRAQLAQNAFHEINWHVVAEHYIGKLEELEGRDHD